ncbi:hypothetical protein [Streptacidiphilus sp. EB103A]|uniref:hypothetical protein n=1 Tax=Streptacidiphilus sp. EB103A TaxID=3156275 RepID=UPI003511F35D
MGRHRRTKVNKSWSEGDRFRINGHSVGLAEVLAAGAELGSNVEDSGQTRLLNAPELGFGKIATGIDRVTGELTAGYDPIPVALFEPERIMMINEPGRRPREIQVEAAISAGLNRIPAGPMALLPSPNWSLHRLADERLELRSPDGGAFSRIRIAPDPSWISSAVSHRQVLVFYGPRLGVRVPPGVASGSYPAHARRGEFRSARQAGLVAGGLVAFHNNR